MGETTAIPWATTSIQLVNSDCDRCGKRFPVLNPFKLSEKIIYYRKAIHFPWLCLRCFRIEKEKWWKKHVVDVVKGSQRITCGP